MPELRRTGTPHRAELLRSVGAKLHEVVAGFRPLAEDLLADTSRIDLFGVAGDGTAVLALVGDATDDPEAEPDLLLVARALAQREWLALRLADWLKLAPDLGIDPDRPPHAVVLCRRFGRETTALAGAQGAAAIRLATWHPSGDGRDLELRAEPSSPAEPERRAALRALDSPAPFRSGLSDRDLGLSDEERAEFE